MNLEELQLIEKVENKDSYSMCLLGYNYIWKTKQNGKGDYFYSPEKGFLLIYDSYKAHYNSGLYYLAYLYYQGILLPKDTNKAIILWKHIANSNINSKNMLNSLKIYNYDISENDFNEAMKPIEKLATEHSFLRYW